MPTTVADWVSLLILVGILLGVLRTYFRVEGMLSRVDVLDKWKGSLKVESKDELDKEYASRDLVDFQLRELKTGYERVEALVRDTKTDLRESMHALRNDLLTLFKPPPHK